MRFIPGTANDDNMKSKKQRSPDRAEEDRKRNDALNDPDKNQKQDKLPGDYPAKEDIMNRLNTERVGLDVENFSRAIGPENASLKKPVAINSDDIEDDPLTQREGIEDRNDVNEMEHPIPVDMQNDGDNSETEESDVTEEDMQALGPKDLSMDMGEDEQLRNRVWPVDMAGEDLDVPGSELDDASEAIGSEDEENNSYSLGGDGHEDNLEGK